MTTFADRHRSDFNFSGAAGSFGDILWRDHAGDNVLWLMANTTAATGGIATLPFVTPDWHFKAAADFSLTGSGDADILWQNDNGSLVLWQMEGATVSAINALPDPGPTWHVIADNDFNGDTADDILFQNDNGSLALWLITGTSPPTILGIFAGTQNPGPTWHVVGTGDTNPDPLERAAILWQNDNGALALWDNVSATAETSGSFTFNTVVALPAVDPSWHAKGMADVSGDNLADIIFQNDSGAVAIWEMGGGASGTTISAMNLVNINPGPGWHIVGLRDMNRDGRADILFQHDNGAAAVWESYASLGGGVAGFFAAAINPNPNPNGHIWDLL